MVRRLVFSVFVLSSAAGFAAGKFFTVNVGSFSKDYPIIKAPGDANIEIAYLADLVDNFPLARAVAVDLTQKMKGEGILDKVDVVVVPGDKGNMMAGVLMEKIYEIKPSVNLVILRTTAKGGSYKSIDYSSISSPGTKVLHMRRDQFESLKDKNVVIFDDVISTGGTVIAVRDLLKEADANVVAYGCFATEGNDVTTFDEKPLFKVTHLPITKIL